MKSFANDHAGGDKDPLDIVLAVLKELSVSVTSDNVRDSLYSHPYFPSLLCISDCLERWGVDTLALEIPASALAQLPFPLLVHCPSAGTDPFRIIQSAGERELVWMDSRRQPLPVSLEEFCGVWDGKVLVMEKRDQHDANGFAGKGNGEGGRATGRWGRVTGRWLAIAVVCLPLLAGIWRTLRRPGSTAQDLFFYVSLLMAGVSGVLITGLLIGYEQGRGNSRLRQWCSLSPNMSCSAVLQSKAARLWGRVSWSELGLIYFSGSLLYGCLAGIFALSPEPLVGCYYLSAGYVVFSLGYQGLIVRKWCLLCLVVQGLLLWEWLAALLTGQPAGLTDGWFLAGAYLFAAACWVLLGPLWARSLEAPRLKQRLNRLKRNEKVFETLLAESEPLRFDTRAIALPLAEAATEHSILLISNPYCAPCGRMHRRLAELLEKDNRWTAGVIFSIVEEDKYTVAAVAAFIEASNTGGVKGLTDALHGWYERSSGEEAVPMKDGGSEETRRQLAAMSDWCRRQGVRHTPAVYVDGRLLPEHYEIEDLQFIY